MTRPAIPLARYRHYEAGVFDVLRLVPHGQTGQWIVVYRKIQGGDEFWIEADQWFAVVDDHGTRRFTEVAA